ncbi:TetR/AcrR family transcriptional regulator [Streptomyces atroolivaceus]|uniref:TetR/AcrR family transcriptional regulator n=1 Tax=Streptomyces atroolivaceus TaxID=66869 RepID=UPI0037A8B2D6
MTRTSDSGTGREQRPRTFIEQARRAQLLDVTIGLVAEHGYAGTSLARIAAGAGITKAAVLYHFPSKEAVVVAARNQVLGGMARHVGEAVEAVGAEEAPGAYVRSMIGYLRDNPRQTRMIVEALGGTGDRPDRAMRRQPLAEILAAAREARGLSGVLDFRTLAVVTGGSIDAVVSEHLADPGYDTAAAADLLVGMLERSLFA